jgi:hypothetical protein
VKGNSERAAAVRTMLDEKIIMETYPRSFIWKCQTCRVCGVASVTEQSSINSVIGFIIRDHGEKSPKCESGDNEIRIQSEEEAA